MADDDEIIDADLDEESLDDAPEDLDEEEAIDPDLDDDFVAADDALVVEEDDEDDEDEAAAPAKAKKDDDESDDEDDDELDPDDVEADLDMILKDRIAAQTDEDDDEEEEGVPEVDDRAESGGGRILPKRPGEFVCQSCFLVKHPNQLADPDALLCLDCV